MMTCEVADSAGWIFGVACALFFCLGVLAAIGQAPPLHAHGGTVLDRRYPSSAEQATPWLALFVPPLWAVGAWMYGFDATGAPAWLACYAGASVQAAVVIVGAVLLPLMFSAGGHIARRSLR